MKFQLQPLGVKGAGATLYPAGPKNGREESNIVIPYCLKPVKL